MTREQKLALTVAETTLKVMERAVKALERADTPVNRRNFTQARLAAHDARDMLAKVVYDIR